MKTLLGLSLLLVSFFVQAQGNEKQITSSSNSELSLLNSVQPLFIVDGIKRPKSTDPSKSAISDINPNNIQKMEVLKGNEAILLYSEEGKDGVIVVTTKSKSFKKSKE